jgi:hypothetical protein
MTYDVNTNLYDIEEEFYREDSSKNNGGGKKRRGKKTIRAIADESSSNAEEQRKIDVKLLLIKDLRYFPYKGFHEDQVAEIVNLYSNWILSSLDLNRPDVPDINKEIEFTQTRSSGPGGQNVNKVNSAVIARHLITGIYTRSEGRDATINKKRSMEKLILKLERHVSNWKIYLKVAGSSDKERLIKDLITQVIGD